MMRNIYCQAVYIPWPDQPKVLLRIPYLVLLIRTFAINELND